MDALSPDRRSENMRRIRSVDTAPEMAVRKAAHRLGYRYRLHRKDLPGRPDLVFPSRKAAIFVHGCFWHQHSRCREGRVPGSNRQYWSPKLAANVARDSRNRRKLRRLGWRVLTVWECEVSDSRLDARIVGFLDDTTRWPFEQVF